MSDSIPIELPYKFIPRMYQLPAWEALESGKKRIVAAWHRGSGKDLLFLNYIMYAIHKKPGVYLHCFPSYSQGKRNIWKSTHQTHKDESISYLDHFPSQLIKSKNGTDMSIEFWNGSIYRVMGLDGKNAAAARGMNPQFIILSEYAYMDPESWYTIEPRISQNDGTAVFLSTPNGQNHFYHLYNHAVAHPEDYFASQLTIADTKTIALSHLDKLRAEGVPEDFILQEYFCDFRRGAEGSYYGKLIQKARDEKRIDIIPILQDYPVHTGWDIGIGDSTAIWFFQELDNGRLFFLNYYENNGESLAHYLNYLEEWRIKNNVIYGRHFVPHDMGHKEFTSGLERTVVAKNLGYNLTVVPVKSVEDGIQCVRSTLPLCSFHSVDCKRGVQCLDFYRKKYNDTLKVYYDSPMHDQWSHGSDAFRIACTGLKLFGGGARNNLTSDRIKEMRSRHIP